MRRGPRPATNTAAPDTRTLLRVLPDLWPREHPGLRIRVIVALVFLVLAKAAVLITPFIYRDAVDALTGDTAMMAVPVFLVIAYGVSRLMTSVFQQLRDLIFAPVGQHALRQLGLVLVVGPLLLPVLLAAAAPLLGRLHGVHGRMSLGVKVHCLLGQEGFHPGEVAHPVNGAEPVLIAFIVGKV